MNRRLRADRKHAVIVGGSTAGLLAFRSGQCSDGGKSAGPVRSEGPRPLTATVAIVLR